jgi:hypothetical protein
LTVEPLAVAVKVRADVLVRVTDAVVRAGAADRDELP